MGLFGLCLMLQNACLIRHPAYLGHQFVIGGWCPYFPNCLQCGKLFWWYQIKQWTAKLHKKLLISNCATNKETTNKKEDPKTICKYLSGQGSSVKLNVSNFSQLPRIEIQQKSHCCVISKNVPEPIYRYCTYACIVCAIGI